MKTKIDHDRRLSFAFGFDCDGASHSSRICCCSDDNESYERPQLFKHEYIWDGANCIDEAADCGDIGLLRSLRFFTSTVHLSIKRSNTKRFCIALVFRIACIFEYFYSQVI